MGDALHYEARHISMKNNLFKADGIMSTNVFRALFDLRNGFGIQGVIVI